MRWRDVPPLSSIPEEVEEVKSEVTEVKGSISHYFVHLFVVGYYGLVLPFKPVFEPESGSYVLYENRVQKILCYLSWTLSTLNRITVIRRTSPFQLPYTPDITIRYFHFTHAVIHAILYAVYYATATTSKTEIQNLLNSISSSPHLQNFRKTRLLLISSQLVWALLALSSPIIGYEIINSRYWSTRNISLGYVSQGRYTFFLSSSIDSPVSELTPLDHITALLQTFITTSHVFLLFFIVCLFGNACVVLWVNATGFCEAVLKSDVESVGVNEAFENATKVSRSVNSCFLVLSFWYVIDLISWLSTELDSGLATDDFYVKGHVGYYCFYVCCCLWYSAEAFRKIIKLKQTMTLNQKNQEQTTQINQIIDSLPHSITGLGEVGFFKLTYSFIGQITGLVITFYMISVSQHEVYEELE